MSAMYCLEKNFTHRNFDLVHFSHLQQLGNPTETINGYWEVVSWSAQVRWKFHVLRKRWSFPKCSGNFESTPGPPYTPGRATGGPSPSYDTYKDSRCVSTGLVSGAAKIYWGWIWSDYQNSSGYGFGSQGLPRNFMGNPISIVVLKVHQA